VRMQDFLLVIQGSVLAFIANSTDKVLRGHSPNNCICFLTCMKP
jgi:hypothetical protein